MPRVHVGGVEMDGSKENLYLYLLAISFARLPGSDGSGQVSSTQCGQPTENLSS